jgi:DNA-binding NtrC family response regulator
MKHSILIVDDDKAVRENLTKYFSSQYITHSASNGREAIRMIGEIGDIEIILSDLEMPSMDGIELLEKIQAVNKNIATIIISGSPEFMSADDVLKKGAFGYFTKPVDLDNLDSTIRNALKSRGKPRPY